ncbi:MAG: PIG-L family deacetylase [Dokdonia sp.]|jgi:LmbE family N-acetylglucosaminyl deacetylase
MRHICTTILLVCFSLVAKIQAQGITLKPEKPTASEIFEDLKKLNFLGSVLYVAAHPDDENTTAISYFANTVKARTAYLSLTRGDGGQNIIGPELRELLGVIRTQELLAARATDGGEQRFTRANDFGYSKHPDETLAIWNKEEVLSDVVWTIRNFKPDVIINRFDHRSPGSTHGHHTSSAMLAVEAFDLAGKPNVFPEQLTYTSPWTPKRQFFNTSWWFYGSREAFAKADKSNLVKVDVGTYYPGLGLSNTEISALSRSQHKSQGFGNTGRRGVNETYFELIKGNMPSNNDIFEGIDTSWNRVKGGQEIGKLVDRVIENYDFKAPQKSVPALVNIYKAIQNIDDTHWKTIKSADVKALIKACAGLYLEAKASSQMVTLGDSISLSLEATNRSSLPIRLQGAVLSPTSKTLASDEILSNNTPWITEETVAVDASFLSTDAYWLQKEGTLGMYHVEDQNLIGQPETPRNNTVVFNILIDGTLLSYEQPIVYKFNDRVKGEVYEPFEVVPAASVALDSKVQIFAKAQPKEIIATVTAHQDQLSGSVKLKAPKNWTISESQRFSNLKKGEQRSFTFTVSPPDTEAEASLIPEVTTQEGVYYKEMVQIDYEHIPLQTLFLPAQAKIVRLDIKRKGDYIGYIQGAGDAVPDYLTQMGYQVAILDPTQLTPDRLSQFDAVVVGIRAYNVVEAMQQAQPLLLDYVKNGGTMIAQYNTSGRWGNTKIGPPYPLQLSRDRVTDEFSEVRILAKEHSLINFPNKITAKDFDGWTQERGLYFPDQWDGQYTPILSMNDKGETPKDGSLLIAPYGEGHYIYTGLSFFRELPAGVSGAYKLFANMLSVGQQQPQSIKQ